MQNKIAPDKIKKALLQLEFTEKEIATYVALLELGASSVQDISRRTGINRVSIYEAIAELKTKGLVAESRKGKKKKFVAEDPEGILELVRTKKAKLHAEENNLQNAILPMLKAINVQQENKPQIKFFEGLEGIYKVYDDYILNNSDVIGCGSYDSVMKVSSWKVERAYIEEMRKRKIVYRGILEDTEINHKFDDISKGIMHNKFLPVGEKVSADVLIFGSSVALISYEKKSATLIEDESIAKSLCMYLSFMWERL
jgi:HTH-type transcriptional regulator, sugar sensing transcriptional regulator